MIELSQGLTIATPPQLCDDELDTFIARAAEPPARKPRGFGQGFLHTNRLPQPGPINLALELRQLATRPSGFLGYGRGHQEFGVKYRDGEMGLQAGQNDVPKETRKAVLAVSAVMEIYENIEWALARVGQTPDVLGAIGAVRPDVDPARAVAVLNDALPVARGFIGELPTRDAALRLRQQRHRNPTNVWEANDLRQRVRARG